MKNRIYERETVKIKNECNRSGLLIRQWWKREILWFNFKKVENIWIKARIDSPNLHERFSNQWSPAQQSQNWIIKFTSRKINWSICNKSATKQHDTCNCWNHVTCHSELPTTLTRDLWLDFSFSFRSAVFFILKSMRAVLVFVLFSHEAAILISSFMLKRKQNLQNCYSKC